MIRGIRVSAILAAIAKSGDRWFESNPGHHCSKGSEQMNNRVKTGLAAQFNIAASVLKIFGQKNKNNNN